MQRGGSGDSRTDTGATGTVLLPVPIVGWWRDAEKRTSNAQGGATEICMSGVFGVERERMLRGAEGLIWERKEHFYGLTQAELGPKQN